MSLSASEESTKQKQAEVSFSPLWATSSREPPSQNRGLRNRITHITPCGALCPALGLQNSIALSIPKTAALNSGIISRGCPPIAFRKQAHSNMFSGSSLDTSLCADASDGVLAHSRIERSKSKRVLPCACLAIIWHYRSHLCF